ncbi:MAG TPA: hypothetical protein VKA03_03040 [Methylovirgula sp.]|nr:hypothetical protein [Methylovirgula sp.]
MFSIAKYALIFAAAPLLMMGAAGAADSSDYGGSFTESIVHREARPLDAQGRVALADVLQGKNTNTGRQDYMDGAQILATDALALDKGNGPQNGIITFIKDGKTASSEYSGSVKTVMVDGKPQTSGEGTWKSLPGEAMIGSGTYHWAMTSETDLSGEWEGHLEGTASAQ